MNDKPLDFSKFKAVKEPLKSLVGNTGEYLVCAELSRREIIALMTPKNNPLFDVIALNPDGNLSVTISIKTAGQSNSTGWMLNSDFLRKRDNPNLIVILVNLQKNMTDYYIYQFDDLVEKVLIKQKSTKRRPSKLMTPYKKRKEIISLTFNDVDEKNKNNWRLISEKLQVTEWF